jgi:hypothetical protein
MSTEEQDLLLGRMVRERADVQRHLALTGEQFRKLFNDLQEVVRLVNSRAQGYTIVNAPPIPSLPETFTKYFDGTNFIELLTEQARLTKRAKELGDGISASGGV